MSVVLFFAEGASVISDIFIYTLKHDMIETATVAYKHKQCALIKNKAAKRCFHDDGSRTVSPEDRSIFPEYVSFAEGCNVSPLDAYIDGAFKDDISMFPRSCSLLKNFGANGEIFDIRFLYNGGYEIWISTPENSERGEELHHLRMIHKDCLVNDKQQSEPILEDMADRTEHSLAYVFRDFKFFFMQSFL